MMSATLVLIALCWLGIGVAAAVRWLLADDRQTVELYRHGLGALGGVTAHTGSRDPDEVPGPPAIGHVRLLTADESSQLPARPRRRQRSVVPPSRRRRRGTSPRAPRPRPAVEVGPAQRVVVTTPDLVIDATGDETAGTEVVAAPAAGRTVRPPIRVLAERRRRRPRGWHVGVAAAVLVVAGALAVRSHSGHPTAQAAETHGRAATVAPTPTTAPPAPAAPPAAHLALTQLNGIPGELAVTLPAADVAVGIDASQRCWVEVRNGDRRGEVVFSGTVDPGQPLHVTTLNPAWIRLGNPAGVTLSLNGASLTVPGDTPVDISVQPSATTS